MVKMFNSKEDFLTGGLKLDPQNILDSQRLKLSWKWILDQIILFTFSDLLF